MISDDEAREKLVLAADLIADDDSVETSSASASPTGVDDATVAAKALPEDALALWQALARAPARSSLNEPPVCGKSRLRVRGT